ncbi:MAG: PDZ domain-containing protein [Deltaproteobacteria bacterium]|jgi:C-terminal processing protease CtpA/Prc|nr:PDZ domain-containing protein [Deltaproteobacteria bacterium]MBW2535205.1 PDZ domain-containing protein [Deltaproteobacteria bacterium]
MLGETTRSTRLGPGATGVALCAAAATLGLALATLSGCSGSTEGSIGAILGQDSDTGALHVRETPDGMGAAKAGLIPGDRIVMIDGVHVDSLDAEGVRALLRGDVGSKVKLTVLRGEQVLHVVVTRGELRDAKPLPPKEERIE